MAEVLDTTTIAYQLKRRYPKKKKLKKKLKLREAYGRCIGARNWKK